MQGLSQNSTTEHVRALLFSALPGVGQWYTDGLVKEGGDASVSITPIGQMFLMIACKSAASEQFFNMISTPSYFDRGSLQVQSWSVRKTYCFM